MLLTLGKLTTLEKLRPFEKLSSAGPGAGFIAATLGAIVMLLIWNRFAASRGSPRQVGALAHQRLSRR